MYSNLIRGTLPKKLKSHDLTFSTLLHSIFPICVFCPTNDIERWRKRGCFEVNQPKRNSLLIRSLLSNSWDFARKNKVPRFDP